MLLQLTKKRYSKSLKNNRNSLPNVTQIDPQI